MMFKRREVPEVRKDATQVRIDTAFREAIFHWLTHSVAVTQPNYRLSEIRELEMKIQRNILEIVSRPEPAWDACEHILKYQALEPEKAFVVASVAFRSLENPKIQKIVEACLNNKQACAGLISAICWLPVDIRDNWIEKFKLSKDIRHKWIAVRVLRYIQLASSEYIRSLFERPDCVADVALHTECIRLVGELKRDELKQYLYPALDSNNSEIAFWSAWSLVLLGERDTVARLIEYAKRDGPWQNEAVKLVFRVLPIDSALQLISILSKKPEHMRIAVKAAGILGDPHLVPWLIGRMSSPQLARVAGESFYTITGIHLDENGLILSLPDIEDSLPNDNTDFTSFEVGEDEYLSWPNVEKLKVIWQTYHKKFSSGQRYLVGKKISPESVCDQLQNGYQRQRSAAAYELALLDKASIFNNIEVKF